MLTLSFLRFLKAIEEEEAGSPSPKKGLRGSKSASARLGHLEKYDEFDAYGAAKGIYASESTPLLSHIWYVTFSL